MILNYIYNHTNDETFYLWLFSGPTIRLDFFIPCWSILQEQWSPGDGLHQTLLVDQSLCPADCRIHWLSPWLWPCQWKLGFAPAFHSATTRQRPQTSVSCWSFPMTVFCSYDPISIHSERNGKNALYQNSAAFLQFDHSVIRQVNFHRANIGHLRLTTFLIFSNYLEWSYHGGVAHLQD